MRVAPEAARILDERCTKEYMSRAAYLKRLLYKEFGLGPDGTPGKKAGEV